MISLTHPMKHCVKNFILNPKTISLSIQWYQALYDLLSNTTNKSIPPALEIMIPVLDVKLQIPLYEKNLNAEEVTKGVLNELDDFTEQNDVLNDWIKSNDFRLCWKKCERLEWISLEKDGVWNDLLKCPQFVEQV